MGERDEDGRDDAPEDARLPWYRGLHYRFIGIDPTILARCGRVERILHTTLALAVALTVSLAVLYGTISSAIYTTGRTEIGRGNVGAGLLVGGGIYVLERVLLATFTRDTRPSLDEDGDEVPPAATHLVLDRVRLFALAGVRILFAFVIASLVAEPILLVFYADDIEVVLQERRDQEAPVELAEVDENYEQELADEVPSSPAELEALRSARLAVEELEAERQGLETAAATAQGNIDKYEELALCEENGAQSQRCQDLLGSADSELSGEESCEELCQGHRDNARINEEALVDILIRAQRIDQVDMPKAVADRDAAEEAADGSLEVDLDRGGEEAFVARSEVSARIECAKVPIEIAYAQINEDDLRLPYLLGYCNTETGATTAEVRAAGEKELAEMVAAPKKYSGLQPRQEAFEVLSECQDPMGLRTPEQTEDEPMYCNVASGKAEAETAEGSMQNGDDSVFATVRRPLKRVLDIGDSTMSQGATRLAWVILILDLLPLFLKLSMSLRLKRPYDAAVTLEKDLALARVDDDRVRLLIDRPAPQPPKPSAKGPAAPNPSGRETGPTGSPSSRPTFEDFPDDSLSVRIEVPGFGDGSLAQVDLGRIGKSKQVIVKRPLQADTAAGTAALRALALREARFLELHASAKHSGSLAIPKLLAAKGHEHDADAGKGDVVLVIEYYPRGSLDQVLGLDAKSRTVRVDLTARQLLTLVYQQVWLLTDLWRAGYCHLDPHMGNWVVTGRPEDDVPLAVRPVHPGQADPGLVKMIDFNVSWRIGEKWEGHGLAQGQLIPFEFDLVPVNPLWDVYALGHADGMILTGGLPLHVSVDHLRGDPTFAAIASLLIDRWGAVDPSDRVRGIRLDRSGRVDRDEIAIRNQLIRELDEVWNELDRRQLLDTPVLRQGQPNRRHHQPASPTPPPATRDWKKS